MRASWGSYLATLLLLSTKVSGDDECQPYQWRLKHHEVGEIICRYDTTTGPDVNYYTCTQIADKYGISFEKLRDLNPVLDKDCKAIKPNTTYCVAGSAYEVHEPLRAWDGLCGPQHDNATCIGTTKQCCNAETWQCGDTQEDCEAGTCYEGACASATEYNYTLDGNCGPKYGDQKCGGKWGDCCNFGGVCGTGPDFCHDGKCESGNCTQLLNIQDDAGIEGSQSGESKGKSLPWQTGTTKDGTCGGDNHYTCDVLFGTCCSSRGVCGSDMEHCGNGCQSKYGKCSNGTNIIFLEDYEQF
ncbi:hypothetical protein AAE478_000326 [Parahypoxylon ruwenzoriense]